MLKTEQGQRQERLKNAIEHLGHKSDSVRLGGAYELFHLAEETENLRQTVLDILCAHIRHTTHENDYQKEHRWGPSEEIQSLLTLLFVQEYHVFKGSNVNLRGSWLKGADLEEARLQGADLSWVRLQGANLQAARLQEADLLAARLQEASLLGVWLQEAHLQRAWLQGANLWGAGLQGANLLIAKLQGAHLWRAGLQGANLQGAMLKRVVSQR